MWEEIVDVDKVEPEGDNPVCGYRGKERKVEVVNEWEEGFDGRESV